MNELLSWVIDFYELKLGLSEWKRMKQNYWWKQGCATLWDHSRLVVVWEQFHDCFLLKLPVKYYPEKVSKKKPSVGYDCIFHYWGTPYTCMGCFSEVFWEENIFWILFLRNKYLVIWVLPLLLQNEEDLWEVSVGSL